MTTAAQPQKWIGAGRFDSINSTYRHKIFLSNGRELTGYSKSLLTREATDKTVLLEKAIVRLVNKGYLFGKTQKYGDTTFRIEFYLNGQYTGTPDELIFILMPDTYIFGNNEDFVTNIRLNTFFKRLYEQVKKGELVTKSLCHKSGNFTEENLFDVTKKRFLTEPALYTFMQNMIKDGHAFGLVMNFYNNYKKRWL